jgi:hypothetical protein
MAPIHWFTILHLMWFIIWNKGFHNLLPPSSVYNCLIRLHGVLSWRQPFFLGAIFKNVCMHFYDGLECCVLSARLWKGIVILGTYVLYNTHFIRFSFFSFFYIVFSPLNCKILSRFWTEQINQLVDGGWHLCYIIHGTISLFCFL